MEVVLSRWKASALKPKWYRGEDCAAPPQRGTGHWEDWRSKNNNYKGKNIHYIPALHWVGKTKCKIHQEIPTSRGHIRRTIQHDNGRPNSPTTPLDHASLHIHSTKLHAVRLLALPHLRVACCALHCTSTSQNCMLCIALHFHNTELHAVLLIALPREGGEQIHWLWNQMMRGCGSLVKSHR